MDQELLYRIALSRTPHIGDVHTRILIQHFGTATEIFNTRGRLLEKLEGIGPVRAASIRKFNAFQDCEKEMTFLRKFQIRALFLTDADYPKRLQHAYDSPCLLYYKGTADLNRDKILSVVGTRRNTDYGRWACEQFIEGLSEHKLLIVSGLAYGIDAIAHKSSLQNGLDTVATLAHGLDRIYPQVHRSLAMQMVEQGGLLTDMGMGTKPDRQHFPRRNRITAALCDALLVIESGEKGGSLITAGLANDYHRDVFAVPGRLSDPLSAGCNRLIATQCAQMVTNAAELVTAMNWNLHTTGKQRESQASLFPELSPEAQHLLRFLETNGMQPVDHLLQLGIGTPGQLAGLLLDLEMQGFIRSLPGKQYALRS